MIHFYLILSFSLFLNRVDTKPFTENNFKNRYSYKVTKQVLWRIKMSVRNVYIKTFGCAMNQDDSEIMGGVLLKSGYSLVSSLEDADVIIVNTCGVKETTENRVLSYLKKIDKINNKVKIVAGCLPLMNLEKVVKAIPSYSAIIGPEYVDGIDKVLSSILNNGPLILLRRSRRAARNLIPKARFSRIIGIVPIANGCLNACTFCSVKFSRGHLKSYPLQDIIAEIEWLISHNYREIWLTAQDTGIYGFDIGITLIDLLEKIEQLDGEFYVRVGMMNPSGILDFAEDLARIYSKSKKLFKFVHLPVQSGSDRILELMRRGHSVNDFIKIVNTFRKYIPNITLSTDIIVGFPSESEDDFYATVELLKTIKPDIVNISRYGKRPNTLAAKMPNQIPTDVKKNRSRLLSKIVDEISLENNRKWLYWEGNVLIDEISKTDDLIGRNIFYKPIVIKSDMRNNISTKVFSLIGQIKKVRVESFSSHVLFGRFA